MGKSIKKIIVIKLKVVPDTNQGIKAMEENQQETINFPITLYYIFTSSHSHLKELGYNKITINNQEEFDRLKGQYLLVKDEETAKNVIASLKQGFNEVEI